MNIAKIIKLTQNGKPWSFTDPQGVEKTFYPHDIVFDDHATGQVNAMTVPPAYKVGDMVGYEKTGSTPRGADKLKITRNPKPGQGTVTSPGPMDSSNPDLEAARPSFGGTGALTHVLPPSAPKAQGNPIHGATVGGALARAVDIAIAVNKADDIVLIEELTRKLVGVQQRVESGEEAVPF